MMIGTLLLELTSADGVEEDTAPVLIDPDGIACVNYGLWDGRMRTRIILCSDQVVAVKESCRHIRDRLLALGDTIGAPRLDLLTLDGG